jgi:hypothetical protein
LVKVTRLFVLGVESTVVPVLEPDGAGSGLPGQGMPSRRDNEKGIRR